MKFNTQVSNSCCIRYMKSEMNRQKIDRSFCHYKLGKVSEKSTLIDLDSFDALLPMAIDCLAEEQCKGLVIEFLCSAKGPDYRSVSEQVAAWQVFQDRLDSIGRRIARIRCCGKPIVAIIHADCSSWALSLASLADYILLKDAALKLGFPESKFGLFPGLGASINLMMRMGSEQALPVLTSGKLYSPQEAKKIGLIDALFTEDKDAIDLAKAWISTCSLPQRSLQGNGNGLASGYHANLLSLVNRQLPGNLAVVQIFQDVQNESLTFAYEIEAEAYRTVWQKEEPLALLRLQYYAVQEAIQNAKQVKAPAMQKIAVIGAGMMGAGIAFEAAKAGLQVFLKDVNTAAAEKGKAHAEKLCSKLISLGKMEEAQQADLLKRIMSTENYTDFDGVDLIIEAVFEDKILKHQVIADSMGFLTDKGIFASNTTSLPITDLAKGAKDPKQFIGIHFFSPVDRMPLVEIIQGKETSQETVDKALSFVSRLGKTPIVVQDGPAFFTSRIFFNYLLEGISMILEGIPLEQVEDAARLGGFAVGPLAVLDEITLDLMLHVYKQLPSLHASQKRALKYLEKLIAQGRSGRKSGQGFYDYPADGGKKLYWQDPKINLSKNIPTTDVLKNRLLHVVALDSYRCLADGILKQPIDGDLGAVFGLGYPALHGGVFGHIDHIGINQFTKDCKSFASYGEQWEIPKSLKQLAKQDFKFYTGLNGNWNSL